MFCKRRNRCVLSHLHAISKKEGHDKFQPPLLRNTDHAVSSMSLVALVESNPGNLVSIALLQTATAVVSAKGFRLSWELWSCTPVHVAAGAGPCRSTCTAEQRKCPLRCSKAWARTGSGFAQSTQWASAAAPCSSSLVCICQKIISNNTINKKQVLAVQASLVATQGLSGCILHPSSPGWTFWDVKGLERGRR